jgi:hypothetical protein
MSIELEPKYDWMLRYAGEVARLTGRWVENEEAEAAFEQFGSDHSPEDCAWEEMVDGAR